MSDDSVSRAIFKMGAAVLIGLSASHQWYGILAFSIASLYVFVEVEKN